MTGADREMTAWTGINKQNGGGNAMPPSRGHSLRSTSSGHFIPLGPPSRRRGRRFHTRRPPPPPPSPETVLQSRLTILFPFETVHQKDTTRTRNLLHPNNQTHTNTQITTRPHKTMHASLALVLVLLPASTGTEDRGRIRGLQRGGQEGEEAPAGGGGTGEGRPALSAGAGASSGPGPVGPPPHREVTGVTIVPGDGSAHDVEVLLTTAAAPGGNRTGEVWSVRTGHRGSTVATTVEIDGALAFGIEVDLSPSPPTSPYPLDGTAADGLLPSVTATEGRSGASATVTASTYGSDGTYLRIAGGTAEERSFVRGAMQELATRGTVQGVRPVVAEGGAGAGGGGALPLPPLLRSHPRSRREDAGGGGVGGPGPSRLDHSLAAGQGSRMPPEVRQPVRSEAPGLRGGLGRVHVLHLGVRRRRVREGMRVREAALVRGDPLPRGGGSGHWSRWDGLRPCPTHSRGTLEQPPGDCSNGDAEGRKAPPPPPHQALLFICLFPLFLLLLVRLVDSYERSYTDLAINDSCHVRARTMRAY